MWEAEIARADDFERNSDSFFVNWVDPYKLEEHVEVLDKGQHHEAAGLVRSLVSDEIYVPHSEG